MKLRFNVDQAACFRDGIDCPRSTATIEVHPGELSATDRILIADRLTGIDVVTLCVDDNGTTKLYNMYGDPVRVEAKRPDLAALLEAVRADQDEVEKRQHRHRVCAIGVAESGIDTVSLAKEQQQ